MQQVGPFLLTSSYVRVQGLSKYLDRNILSKALIISLKSIFGSLSRVAGTQLDQVSLKTQLDSYLSRPS